MCWKPAGGGGVPRRPSGVLVPGRRWFRGVRMSRWRPRLLPVGGRQCSERGIGASGQARRSPHVVWEARGN